MNYPTSLFSHFSKTQPQQLTYIRLKKREESVKNPQSIMASSRSQQFLSHVSPSLSKSMVSKVDSMMSIYFPEKS